MRLLSLLFGTLALSSVLFILKYCISLKTCGAISGSGFRMIGMQDGSVLSKETLLLDIYDDGLASLVLLLGTSLVHLDLSLCAIDRELLLPQALDFTFVVKFTHSALLGIHLLKALILGKLLHQLHLKLILHSALFSLALLLQALLISLRV